jgi:hypothetical protein
MFGFVTANASELTQAQKDRYGSVYCGICRQIRSRSSQLARLGLSYDMAFLALLLMSLYEPGEQQGRRACVLHPVHPRPWVDNEYIQYAADMNVALTYYKCLDDWQDDRSQKARFMAGRLKKLLPGIQARYPRQCDAVERCILRLGQLEREGCQKPDEPANCFGELMGELLVYREDLWAQTLRKTGFYLGRFIYLADAVVDYPRDVKRKKYNPLMGVKEDLQMWEQYLVLAMAGCTDYFERLPLVQDKDILDNILYSGVWCNVRKMKRETREQDD